LGGLVQRGDTRPSGGSDSEDERLVGINRPVGRIFRLSCEETQDRPAR